MIKCSLTLEDGVVGVGEVGGRDTAELGEQTDGVLGQWWEGPADTYYGRQGGQEEGRTRPLT